jgi:hypothetical protein
MMSYDPAGWHYEQMRNRPRRRLLSKLLIAVGISLSLGWAIIFPMLQPHATSGIPATLFVIPVGFGMSFSPFAAGVWSSPKMQQDEFEEQATNRATKYAFKIVVILATLLCLWRYIGIAYGLPSPNTAVHWSQWAWTFFSLGAALPVLIAEWIIPMPPKDDLGGGE